MVRVCTFTGVWDGRVRGARPGVVGAPAVGMVRVLAVAAVVTPVVRDVSRCRAFFRRAAFHCFFRFEERDRHCGG